MGLRELISGYQRETVSDDHGSWRQYILDHLDYIAVRSRTYDISEEVANLYRYDLKRFLKEKMIRHEDIAWIVLLLNSIPNDFYFNKGGDLIIPEDRLITNLYQSYRTITNNTN